MSKKKLASVGLLFVCILCFVIGALANEVTPRADTEFAYAYPSDFLK